MTTQIEVPALGESITEAIIGKWLKSVGDAVAQDEPVVELETDKVTIEVNAPVAGVISEITANEDETVEVGAVIGVINGAGGAATVAPAAKTEPAPAKEAAPAPGGKAPASTEPHMSPAVRRLVSEHGLDAATLKATGKGGRLTKADVMTATEGGEAQATAAAPAPEARAPAPEVKAPSGPRSQAEREERVRMTPLRRRIAERLKEAQNTAAMLTTFNEVDMTALMAARNQYRDLFEQKHGVRLGFMSFFVKACVTALKDIPAVNAEIDGDEFVYKNYYDIGVAVSAPRGLVVPVVRDADVKAFAEIEQTIMDFAERARAGKLALEELQGGTFTISNGGVFGSLMSTPILNPPQSGILGMHKIQKRPIAVGDEVAVRPMMYIALSYDHRVIDGREAVTFLVRVKECLEDPNRLLLDL